MKNKSLAILLATAPVVISVAAVMIYSDKNPLLNPVKADTETVVLDSNALKEIELVDVDLGKSKNDKKFKFDLGNERYIEGAVLFNNYNNHFVGNTLGDVFGVDNTNSESANPYNFNIIFSIERSDSLSVDLTETSLTGDSSESTLVQVKSGYIWGGPDFYDRLKNNYAQVTARDGQQGGWYSNSTSYNITMDETSKTATDLNHSPVGFPALALGVTDNSYIQPGNKLQFQLNRIEIKFHCA